MGIWIMTPPLLKMLHRVAKKTVLDNFFQLDS